MARYLILFCSLIFLQGFTAWAQEEATPDIQYIKKILTQKKFSKSFIRDMTLIYEEETFAKVVRLNMLGFLNPTKHATLVSEEGVVKTQDFIRQYRSVFRATEEKYHVPASIIGSLLWVETKHGNLTGRYHVASSYLHLLQAPRKPVLDYLIKTAVKSESAKPAPMKNLKKILTERSKRKAKWALEQLKALEKMYKRKKNLVIELNGSFAGAFGIPQFIPSSYHTYAKAYKTGAVPDLYKPEDAISSVAFYLKKTGWGSKNKQKMKALMHYNNSQDYAESILELGQKVISAQSTNQQVRN
jgi:membrane-bound lytic murein transglycosylase B